MSTEEELEEYGFDISAYRKAQEYERRNLQLDIIEGVLSLASLVVFGIWGAKPLYGQLTGAVGNAWGVRILFVAVFVIGGFILDIPGSWLRYRIERSFDLSNQDLGSWCGDQIKSLGLTLAFAIVTLVPLFWVISVSRYWWLWAWGVGTLFIVFISFISPTVLLPIFYNFEEINDEDLIERLTELANRAKVNIIGVFRMDVGEKTKKATGALTGIGASRRIILSDTMLQNYTEGEIEAVMAHEMGHHKHGDIWILLFEQSLLLLIGLLVVAIFLEGVISPLGIQLNVASLPFILVLIGAVQALLSPVSNLVSRSRERSADEFSLELIDDREALGDALVKLSQQNLGNPSPSKLVEWLFYDHPSGLSRVKRAYGS